MATEPSRVPRRWREWRVLLFVSYARTYRTHTEDAPLTPPMPPDLHKHQTLEDSVMTANRPNPPEAPLIRAAYTRSQWQLTIDCPQCQHQHQHGGGPNLDSAHDYLGHRAAHCGTECVTHGTHQRGNGYILTDPDDVIGQAQHDHAQRDATAAGGPR